MGFFDYINPVTAFKSGLEWLGGKQGYDTAAAGAQDVYGRAQQFAGQQWDRQMEGLQGALGAYGPSQAAWTSMYGSQGPGAMESWWSQNGNRFGQEGAQQGAYNAYQNWMNQPGGAQLGYAQAGQSLAGSNNSAGAYGAMGQGLQSYSGPQQGLEAYRYNQGAYQQPGTAENYFKNTQGRYNQETNAQANYDAYSNALEQQGETAMLAHNMFDTNKVADAQNKFNLMQHQQFAQAPTALQQNEGENKGYIRNANQLNDYLGSQMGALQGPGTYEQFVNSDIMGNNPAYQREKQQGIAQINQEMARRGNFNSGGALTAIGNYTGALDAADYNNRAQRAQQAQQMQLARIGQGLQGTGQAAGLDVQRGGALGSLDTASENAQAQRQGIGLQAEAQYNQNALGRDQLALNAANSADQNQLSRLMGAYNMGQGADQSNLALLNSGQNAANDSQSQMLARLMGQQNAANSVDQTRLASDQQGLARMLASYNMAQGADQTAMQRAQQQYGMGMGLDQLAMQKYAQQQNAAQGLDQYNLASLLGGGNMANQAQSAEQQRMAQAFASLFGMNNAQAGQYGNFYGQGGQLSGQAQNDALQALMAMYGYKAQGANAGSNEFGNLLGMLTNMAGKGKTG
jgi:hypothetical protein